MQVSGIKAEQQQQQQQYEEFHRNFLEWSVATLVASQGSLGVLWGSIVSSDSV